MHSIELYFLLFISYSVFGWVMEVIVKFIQYKRFINRGFLIGPYCPIYGFGALFITLLLNKYIEYPMLLFIVAIIICSILEYMTSLVLEKIYHARWWDYSNKKFNLNGRICVNTMIPFGILGMIMMYVFNPLVFKFYNYLNINTLNIICIIIFSIFLFDLITSLIVLGEIRKDNKALDKDNTEEMRRKVREIILSRGLLHRRLLRAYPNFRYIGIIVKKNINKAKEHKDNIIKKISKK